MEKENLILDRSFAFSLKIIEYAEVLEENRKYILSRQLLRSGTSIGANINEAQSSETKADFIHKLKIADKEAYETEYWLKLCKFSKNYPNPDALIEELVILKKLLSKIISISKKSLQKKTL